MWKFNEKSVKEKQINIRFVVSNNFVIMIWFRKQN